MECKITDASFILTPYNKLKVSYLFKDETYADHIDINKMVILDKPIIFNGLLTKCKNFMINPVDKTFFLTLFENHNGDKDLQSIRYSSLIHYIKIVERERSVAITVYEVFD